MKFLLSVKTVSSKVKLFYRGKIHDVLTMLVAVSKSLISNISEEKGISKAEAKDFLIECLNESLTKEK